MTLEQIANFGEIIGAAGVIASLVFVGWQIKTNTRTTRMRMHEQVTQTYMSFLNSVLLDPGAFSQGLQTTDNSFANLTDEQKMFFFGTMLGLFKHFELMHAQRDNGIMDQETWEAWSEHIRMYFHQPGAQAWWSLRKNTFVPRFRDYLESSERPDMKSFVDIANNQSAV